MEPWRSPRKLEIIISSRKSWSDISRYHRCLYQYRTASAHRVIEWSFVFPSAEKYHRSSERFFDWCLPCLTPISTLMKSGARRIHENMHLISHYENKYLNWLIKHIFMPFISAIRETTNNRFLRNRLKCRCMWECRANTRSRDIDGSISRDPLTPINMFDTREEPIKWSECDFLQFDIDTIGGAKPDIRLHHRPHISLKSHQSILTMCHGNTLTFKFTTNQSLHSRSTCCYKMHMPAL